MGSGREETGSPDGIRQEIRRRLEKGALPRNLPAVQRLQAGEPLSIVMGGGSGRRCSACDAERADVTYFYPDREVAFHDTCLRIWKQERMRMDRPDGLR
jgi:hypothetical protein